jgi:hypothetical protein
MTFSIVQPPHPPPVQKLNPAATEVADFDISALRKQKQFKSLLSYFH